VSKLERISVAKWAEIWANWKESEQTQSEYVQEVGISVTQFKYGIKAARKAGLIPPAGRRAEKLKTKASFLPVRVIQGREVEATECEVYCEIRFEGEHRIWLNSRESVKYLQQLMGGIGAC
jgi:hypothetical protein